MAAVPGGREQPGDLGQQPGPARVRPGQGAAVLGSQALAEGAARPTGAGPPASLDFELVDPGATEVAWSIDLLRLSPEDALDRGFDAAAVERRVLSGRLAIER